ncbi:hypothetical protein MKEN_01132900 [Mycena kentingensis (nom. inval.)]|nr:hypothetical protein MKEN_01132900 [Mycena kentingensis (nom. inval.)]
MNRFSLAILLFHATNQAAAFPLRLGPRLLDNLLGGGSQTTTTASSQSTCAGGASGCVSVNNILGDVGLGGGAPAVSSVVFNVGGAGQQGSGTTSSSSTSTTAAPAATSSAACSGNGCVSGNGILSAVGAGSVIPAVSSIVFNDQSSSTRSSSSSVAPTSTSASTSSSVTSAAPSSSGCTGNGCVSGNGVLSAIGAGGVLPGASSIIFNSDAPSSSSSSTRVPSATTTTAGNNAGLGGLGDIFNSATSLLSGLASSALSQVNAIPSAASSVIANAQSAGTAAVGSLTSEINQVTPQTLVSSVVGEVQSQATALPSVVVGDASSILGNAPSVITSALGQVTANSVLTAVTGEIGQGVTGVPAIPTSVPADPVESLVNAILSAAGISIPFNGPSAVESIIDDVSSALASATDIAALPLASLDTADVESILQSLLPSSVDLGSLLQPSATLPVDPILSSVLSEVGNAPTQILTQLPAATNLPVATVASLVSQLLPSGSIDLEASGAIDPVVSAVLSALENVSTTLPTASSPLDPDTIASIVSGLLPSQITEGAPPSTTVDPVLSAVLSAVQNAPSDPALSSAIANAESILGNVAPSATDIGPILPTLPVGTDPAAVEALVQSIIDAVSQGAVIPTGIASILDSVPTNVLTDGVIPPAAESIVNSVLSEANLPTLGSAPLTDVVPSVPTTPPLDPDAAASLVQSLLGSATVVDPALLSSAVSLLENAPTPILTSLADVVTDLPVGSLDPAAESLLQSLLPSVDITSLLNAAPSLTDLPVTPTNLPVDPSVLASEIFSLLQPPSVTVPDIASVTVDPIAQAASLINSILSAGNIPTASLAAPIAPVLSAVNALPTTEIAGLAAALFPENTATATCTDSSGGCVSVGGVVDGAGLGGFDDLLSEALFGGSQPTGTAPIGAPTVLPVITPSLTASFPGITCCSALIYLQDILPVATSLAGAVPSANLSEITGGISSQLPTEIIDSLTSVPANLPTQISAPVAPTLSLFESVIESILSQTDLGALPTGIASQLSTLLANADDLTTVLPVSSTLLSDISVPTEVVDELTSLLANIPNLNPTPTVAPVDATSAIESLLSQGALESLQPTQIIDQLTSILENAGDLTSVAPVPVPTLSADDPASLIESILSQGALESLQPTQIVDQLTSILGNAGDLTSAAPVPVPTLPAVDPASLVESILSQGALESLQPTQIVDQLTSILGNAGDLTSVAAVPVPTLPAVDSAALIESILSQGALESLQPTQIVDQLTSILGNAGDLTSVVATAAPTLPPVDPVSSLVESLLSQGALESLQPTQIIAQLTSILGNAGDLTSELPVPTQVEDVVSSVSIPTQVIEEVTSVLVNLPTDVATPTLLNPVDPVSAIESILSQGAFESLQPTQILDQLTSILGNVADLTSTVPVTVPTLPVEPASIIASILSQGTLESLQPTQIVDQLTSVLGNVVDLTSDVPTALPTLPAVDSAALIESILSQGAVNSLQPTQIIDQLTSILGNGADLTTLLEATPTPVVIAPTDISVEPVLGAVTSLDATSLVASAIDGLPTDAPPLSVVESVVDALPTQVIDQLTSQFQIPATVDPVSFLSSILLTSPVVSVPTDVDTLSSLLSEIGIPSDVIASVLPTDLPLTTPVPTLPLDSVLSQVTDGLTTLDVSLTALPSVVETIPVTNLPVLTTLDISSLLSEIGLTVPTPLPSITDVTDVVSGVSEVIASLTSEPPVVLPSSLPTSLDLQSVIQSILDSLTSVPSPSVTDIPTPVSDILASVTSELPVVLPSLDVTSVLPVPTTVDINSQIESLIDALTSAPLAAATNVPDVLSQLSNLLADATAISTSAFGVTSVLPVPTTVDINSQIASIIDALTSAPLASATNVPDVLSQLSSLLTDATSNIPVVLPSITSVVDVTTALPLPTSVDINSQIASIIDALTSVPLASATNVPDVLSQPATELPIVTSVVTTAVPLPTTSLLDVGPVLSIVESVLGAILNPTSTTSLPTGIATPAPSVPIASIAQSVVSDITPIAAAPTSLAGQQVSQIASIVSQILATPSLSLVAQPVASIVSTNPVSQIQSITADLPSFPSSVIAVPTTVVGQEASQIASLVSQILATPTLAVDNVVSSLLAPATNSGSSVVAPVVSQVLGVTNAPLPVSPVLPQITTVVDSQASQIASIISAILGGNPTPTVLPIETATTVSSGLAAATSIAGGAASQIQGVVSSAANALTSALNLGGVASVTSVIPQATTVPTAEIAQIASILSVILGGAAEASTAVPVLPTSVIASAITSATGAAASVAAGAVSQAQGVASPAANALVSALNIGGVTTVTSVVPQVTSAANVQASQIASILSVVLGGGSQTSSAAPVLPTSLVAGSIISAGGAATSVAGGVASQALGGVNVSSAVNAITSALNVGGVLGGGGAVTTAFSSSPSSSSVGVGAGVVSVVSSLIGGGVTVTATVTTTVAPLSTVLSSPSVAASTTAAAQGGGLLGTIMSAVSSALAPATSTTTVTVTSSRSASSSSVTTASSSSSVQASTSTTTRPLVVIPFAANVVNKVAAPLTSTAVAASVSVVASVGASATLSVSAVSASASTALTNSLLVASAAGSDFVKSLSDLSMAANTLGQAVNGQLVSRSGTMSKSVAAVVNSASTLASDLNAVTVNVAAYTSANGGISPNADILAVLFNLIQTIASQITLNASLFTATGLEDALAPSISTLDASVSNFCYAYPPNAASTSACSNFNEAIAAL